MFEFFKNLFSNKTETKKLRKNAALSVGDKRYVEYLIEKKRKALNKKGKRLTVAHKETIIAKVKSKRNAFYESKNQNNSGWGPFEYYLFFHWMNSPSDHYYSNDYLSSTDYQSATDNSDFKGEGGEFGGAGASSSWDDNTQSTQDDNSSAPNDSDNTMPDNMDSGDSDSSASDSSDSSDCSSDSSADYSSSDSGGSDFGGGGSSDF